MYGLPVTFRRSFLWYYAHDVTLCFVLVYNLSDVFNSARSQFSFIKISMLSTSHSMCRVYCRNVLTLIFSRFKSRGTGVIFFFIFFHVPFITVFEEFDPSKRHEWVSC